MFDSLGLGELGLIFVVAMIFIDPSKIGTLARGLATLRRKWAAIQRDVKQQFDMLTLEENLRESSDAIRTAKVALRREALDAVRALTAADRAVAAEAVEKRLEEWPTYVNAKTVALFCGTRDEIDTENLIRKALADGKAVYLPRIEEGPAGGTEMRFVRVQDFDRELSEGMYGILEPALDLTAEADPALDLILVPGTAFDERGGRIGRGKGFYDRFLGARGTRSDVTAGLAFEAQIVRKKLPLEPHDQLLDALVTERRLLEHSRAQTA
jgi:5-formyltetrahydrofolate cyclo-ligase